MTRAQVDAYRFGQRRLEAALARRDPVLLHEEIRVQRRTVTTGLVLACLVLLAFFGYAKVADKPAWERQSIITAKQSGRMYVVIGEPRQLVPVRNMVAARLVAAASRQAGRGASGSTASTVIDDAVLERAPRTAAAGVAGADGVRLPSDAEPLRIGPWAVCDVGPSTVLIVGAGPGVPMPRDQALLLKSPEGEIYLLTGGRRHRLDDVLAVQRAYDLVDVQARPVSAALLGLIPEGRPLAYPDIPDAGAAAPDSLPARVGDIVRTSGAGGERYYLVLTDGVVAVSVPIANLIRGRSGIDRSRPAISVPAEQLNGVARRSLAALDGIPDVMPRVPTGPDTATACWQWDDKGSGGAINLSAVPPIPPTQQVTQLARADGPGPGLDRVSVPTGKPLVVRTAVGGSGAALWLVSDTGVAFRVAGGAKNPNETATALGIRPEAADPAPGQALQLLPAGADVDLQNANRTVDVLIGPAES